MTDFQLVCDPVCPPGCDDRECLMCGPKDKSEEICGSTGTGTNMSLVSIMNEFAPKALKLCQGYLRGAWNDVVLEKFIFKPVSGGLSNYLYLCELPAEVAVHDGEPRQVLIRLYGQIMDFSARVYEGVIFSLLSERGFGPRLYGIFPSGRIEQYIPSRNLTTDELSEPMLSAAIAKQVAVYHSMQLPLNTEPCFIWNKMDHMLERIRDLKLTTPKDVDIMKEINLTLDLVAECKDLKDYLQNQESKVVFCHNDLQEGNILLLKSNGKAKIQMIDYEYSSYNYREFDLGNHFCEFMYSYNVPGEAGFKKTTTGYPSHEHQLQFISTYLSSMKELNPDMDVDPADDAIERLIVQSDRFALASHMFWGLWSLVQNVSTCIQFGYMEYGLTRLQDYVRMKTQLGIAFTRAANTT